MGELHGQRRELQLWFSRWLAVMMEASCLTTKPRGWDADGMRVMDAVSEALTPPLEVATSLHMLLSRASL